MNRVIERIFLVLETVLVGVQYTKLPPSVIMLSAILVAVVLISSFVIQGNKKKYAVRFDTLEESEESHSFPCNDGRCHKHDPARYF